MSPKVIEKGIEFAVLTFNGEDRIGTVATGTSFLSDRNANIEVSHAARLGGRFCLQLYFSAPKDAMNQIRADYREVLSDFHPVLVEASDPDVDRDVRAMHYELIVYAFDSVGIVSEVAALLAEHGADVVQLAASRYPAPQTGNPLFVCEMKIDIPSGVMLRQIRHGLYRLEQLHGWDLDFRPEPNAAIALSAVTMFPPSRWAARHEVGRDNEARRLALCN